MSTTLKTLIIILFPLLFGVVFLISYTTPDPEFDVEKDIKNGKFHIITYGLELTTPWEMKIKKQLDSLENRYGFEYENRGCIVDSLTMIKAKAYNERIIESLSTRNGANWFEKYQKSVDSLRNINKDIIDF